MSSEDEENLDRDRDAQGEHSRTTGAETSAAAGPGTPGPPEAGRDQEGSSTGAQEGVWVLGFRSPAL